MAVYTKITQTDLSNHLKTNYEIGDLIAFEEIVDGIDNSNFIIHTEKQKYIFTIFENRINKDDLPFFINFKEHLFLNEIACPSPIKAKSKQTIIDFKEKKSIIVSFLNGKTLKPAEDGFYYNISTIKCALVGNNLAKIHLASTKFSQSKPNDLNVFGIEKLFLKFQNHLESYDSTLLKIIPKQIDFIKNRWNASLPSAPCHLDLFPDNVFFNEDGSFAGVIDFYFSANDLLVYDFAIVVNAWCFDKTVFNTEKFDNLLNSYQKIRRFNVDEINFMQTALIMASLRFLCTRLHDYFFTPKDSIVKVKNPNEYKEKLLFFINNKIL